MTEKKKWKVPRAFTMSDTLFGCAKAMARMKRASTSEIVSLCVLEAWEREVEKNGKEKMQTLLNEELEEMKK